MTETKTVNFEHETVNTYELKTGDVVLNSGAVLTLLDRFERDGVVWFHTKCENVKQVLADGIYNASWVTHEDPSQRYTIQGNKLARWARVVKVRNVKA